MYQVIYSGERCSLEVYSTQTEEAAFSNLALSNKMGGPFIWGQITNLLTGELLFEATTVEREKLEQFAAYWQHWSALA